MSNMKNNKALKLTNAVLLGAVSATMVASPALAQDSTGIWGDGKLNPNDYGESKVRWVTVGTNSISTAWDKFNHYHGLSSSNFKSQLSALGVDQEVCKSSKTIWFVVGNNDVSGGYYWVGNKVTSDVKTILFNNGSLSSWDTHYKYGTVGTIRNPILSIGPGPTQDQVNKIYNKYGEAKLESRPWSIICSGQFESPPPQPAGEKWTEYKAGDPDSNPTFTKQNPNDPSTPNVDESITRSRNLAWQQVKETGVSAEFKNPIVLNMDARPDIDPGVKELKAQSQTTKTSFGNLYEQAFEGELNNKTVAEMTTLVNTAVDKDKKLQPEIDLSDQNKEALAEGGVMTVSQKDQPGTIVVKETETVITKRECTRDYVLTNGEWVLGKASCSSWGDEKIGKGSTVNSTPGTQKNKGYYQILVVQCNPEEFKAVKAALGSKIQSVKETNVENGVAGYIQTKVALEGTEKQLGYTNVGNAALNKTGSMEFYDKECGIMCYAPTATNDSGLDAGGNKNGVIDSGDMPNNTLSDPSDGDGTGVKAGGVISQEIVFPRDNKFRNFTVGAWRPMDSLNPSDEAQSTVIMTDPNGTPTAETGDFVLATKDGKPVFGSGEAVEQKSWDVKEFKTPTTAVISGEVTEFQAKANWPSEAEKPHRFAVGWEYDIQGSADAVPTTHAIKLSGGTPNAAVTSNPATLFATIQGRCFSNFSDGVANGKPNPETNVTANYVSKNTGSGALAESPFTTSIGNNNDRYNMTLNFVRSVAE